MTDEPISSRPMERAPRSGDERVGRDASELSAIRQPQSAADPLWYKDAVIYQMHVKAFHDVNGDGIGDFAGLTQQLDYIQELGVNTIWLLPFYPSPQRDDGYDIADYCNVHPDYGTLDDFRSFIDEAHRRGLKVITELVINHTSDQHPWFQEARRAPNGSPGARVLCLERRRQEVGRHAHHLHGHRNVQLGLGSRRGPVLLASLLLAPARPEPQQSAASSKRSSRSCASGWIWASTECGSMRFLTCACARARTTRTFPKLTRC